MVKIYNSGNVLETNQILELLKQEGIPAYKKDLGAGGYMTIATGTSFSGADIYVDESQEEKARELVESCFTVEEQQEITASKGNFMRRLFAVIMLLGVVIAMVTVILMQ